MDPLEGKQHKNEKSHFDQQIPLSTFNCPYLKNMPGDIPLIFIEQVTYDWDVFLSS